MKIYLDDDSADPVVAALLRRAGHDVETPADAGKRGSSDAIHLLYAVLNGRVLLSGNHDDFEDLHELILATEGHHPGILIVRKDNDRKRDLSRHGIVQAVGKVVASHIPLVDNFIILNQFR